MGTLSGAGGTWTWQRGAHGHRGHGRQLCRRHHRQRQPDQDRGRHADPDGRQRLHRRHHGQRGILLDDTTSLKGDIHNNAEVMFDQSTTGNYAGAMTGSGSLTKRVAAR